MNDWIKLSGINESVNKDFISFAEARQAGVEKIVSSAEKKRGHALLTRDHFSVKLPYYDNAKNGNFNIEETKKEYNTLCTFLHSKMNKIENLDQKEFQELLGKMEVLGELLIKYHDLNSKAN